jgi:hypothetical protein
VRRDAVIHPWEDTMKIALPFCLLIACSAIPNGVALAAPRNHRPVAVHSGSADDAAKSPITQGTSTDAGASSTAAGKPGDAPIDTSITVNQGHIRDTGKHSVFTQPRNGTVEPTIIGHTKTHLPSVATYLRTATRWARSLSMSRSERPRSLPPRAQRPRCRLTPASPPWARSTRRR